MWVRVEGGETDSHPRRNTPVHVGSSPIEGPEPEEKGGPYSGLPFLLPSVLIGWLIFMDNSTRRHVPPPSPYYRFGRSGDFIEKMSRGIRYHIDTDCPPCRGVHLMLKQPHTAAKRKASRYIIIAGRQSLPCSGAALLLCMAGLCRLWLWGAPPEKGVPHETLPAGRRGACVS